MKEGQNNLTQDMKEGQDRLIQNIKSVQFEMKEEFKGISASRDTLKEVKQERPSTMETRIDSFEEKVTAVETQVLQMKENFQRNIKKILIRN